MRLRHHEVMPDHAPCAARLRSGDRCRSVATEGPYCAYHSRLAARAGETVVRDGLPRLRQHSPLVRDVTGAEPKDKPKRPTRNGAVTPAEVRPLLGELVA